MDFIAREALQASVRLGSDRGPFPRWFQESVYEGKGAGQRRNATVTTVAPTGTISLIADCSSGIEPIYSVAYRRLSFENESLSFVHHLFEQHARKHGFYSDELITMLSEAKGLRKLNAVPSETARVFVTTHEIGPEWHVKMQAAFQKHIDAAVSKTINFPSEASVDDVRNAYL